MTFRGRGEKIIFVNLTENEVGQGPDSMRPRLQGSPRAGTGPEMNGDEGKLFSSGLQSPASILKNELRLGLALKKSPLHFKRVRKNTVLWSSIHLGHGQAPSWPFSEIGNHFSPHYSAQVNLSFYPDPVESLRLTTGSGSISAPPWQCDSVLVT